MPLLFALYWWRRTHKGALRIGHVLAWSGYPLVYFGYVLLRGQMIGFYPYPFIDVAALGYEQVLLNALVMLAAFMLLGLCVVGLDRWQGKCRGQA